MRIEHHPPFLEDLRRLDHRLLATVFSGLVLAGAAAFMLGITGENPQRAWQAYLVNFLFWTGTACGAVLFGAVLNITNARWARPLKRITEAPGAFLPFSFALFLGLYVGRDEIFPWIRHGAHGKEWWLNIPFLFARDGVGLFLFMSVALALTAFSLGADRRAARDKARASTKATGTGSPSPPAESEIRLEDSPDWRIQKVLSVVLALLYASVLTLLAIDLVMSLDPRWVSTLFGAYFFITSLYAGLAMIMILAILLMGIEPLKGLIQPRHFHDLGKLLFGFCVLSGDFFFSQFLVIWYSNLPEESQYVILRIREAPWYFLAWTVLIVSFVGPFVTLLNRSIKMKPIPMLVLSSVILAGIWLERLLQVAPSLWKEGGLPLGFTEIFITGGFFGLMALCLLLFLRSAPLLPTADPLFGEYMREHHGGALHGGAVTSGEQQAV